ncbi:MAG: AbrB/MazE/SpoVT family DNA-binding domain-containing protein [Vulcanimicrobiota bacterium]
MALFDHLGEKGELLIKYAINGIIIIEKVLQGNIIYMKTGKVGIKGQFVIPSSLRKKYRIGKDTRISILDGNGVIILKPLYDDPVSESKGFLKGGSSLLDVLCKERDEESRR